MFERTEVIGFVDLELDADRSNVTGRELTPGGVAREWLPEWRARERVAQAPHARRQAFLSEGAGVAGTPLVGVSEPGVAAAAASAATRGFGVGLMRGRAGRGAAGTAAAAESGSVCDAVCGGGLSTGSAGGSVASAFTSIGSASRAAAGLAATSGVGASTSIELPTMAMLFGSVGSSGEGA